MSFSQWPFKVLDSENILSKLRLFLECHTKTAIVYPEIKCASVSLLLFFKLLCSMFSLQDYYPLSLEKFFRKSSYRLNHNRLH